MLEISCIGMYAHLAEVNAVHSVCNSFAFLISTKVRSHWVDIDSDTKPIPSIDRTLKNVFWLFCSLHTHVFADVYNISHSTHEN